MRVSGINTDCCYHSATQISSKSMHINGTELKVAGKKGNLIKSSARGAATLASCNASMCT